MSFLDGLDERYRLILCDIWGCIHDGTRLYPGAKARLQRWRGEGRSVILFSNAPRPAATVEAQLLGLRLDRSAFDHIVTGGEAGIAALSALHRAVGFIGTRADRSDLTDSGIAIDDGETFDHIACLGFDRRDASNDYRAQFAGLVARGVTMHCLNPDRVAIYGGEEMPCAGALADLYEAMGGAVVWYGKPFQAIYDHALAVAGNPPRDAVLAVGDSFATDALGAARAGLDCLFVAGGIHQGEPFPRDFFTSHGLGDWRPIATVPSLQ